MAALECVMCNAPTNLVCAVCKSATYCSTRCQDRDSPLHNLVCTKLEAFKAENPRPADAFLYRYTLGLLLPKSEIFPKLIWVKTELKLGDESWAYGCDLSNFSDDFEDVDTDHVEHVYRSKAQDEGLEVWPCRYDADYDIEDNDCLEYLMEGCSYLGSSLNQTGLASVWEGGPCVIVGFTNTNTEPYKKYQDITLGDLRRALDWFCNGATYNLRALEGHAKNKFVVLSKWVQGVIISCNGEVNFAKKPKFRPVHVRKDDAVFRAIKVSSIAEHLSFPVVLRSLPVDRIPNETGDRYKNEEALSILLGADPSTDTWNVSCISAVEELDGISSVLVVRKDQQDITTHQAEALSVYCSDILHSAMTEQKGENYDRDIKQAIVDTYMTYEKFCEFFDRYKSQRLRAGYTHWNDATPPPRCIDVSMKKRAAKGDALSNSPSSSLTNVPKDEAEQQRLAKRQKVLDSISSRLSKEQSDAGKITDVEALRLGKLST